MKSNLNTVIRQHILEEIRRNPQESVKISSERELCQLFHASRTTVRRVIAGLVKDGRLIVRHGSGAFSNPCPGLHAPAGGAAPSIGVLLFQGNSLCFDLYYWEILDALRRELATDQGLMLPMLVLSGNTPERAAAEILHLQLDALVWLHPSPNHFDMINRLDAAGLPVVCIARGPENARGSVKYDYAAAGRTIAEYFLAHEVDTPLLVIDGQEKEYADMTQAFCERMARAGKTPDFRRLLVDLDRLEEGTMRLAREKIPVDGLFAFGRAFWKIHELFSRIPGLPSWNSLVIATNQTVHIKGSGHAYLDIDATTLGKAAAQIIRKRFAGDESMQHTLLAATVRQEDRPGPAGCRS